MGECFQTLNLTNAYLFAAALQDEEICRNVLEIALNRKITAVRSHAEHTLFLDSDFKSVRFDVYALDAEAVSYDVEMQNDFGRDLPRRCRYYQAELETLVGKSASRGQKAEGQKERKGNKSKDPDIISYTSGNETIIMPTGYKENTGVNVVLNIFIGLVVGVALMWFLAVPAKVKSVRNQTAAQIREYSDQITAKQTEINNLQSQLDELNGTGADSSESAAEAPGGSYEMLIDAYTSFQAGDTDTATTALDSVKADELSDNAKAIYNQMYGTLHADDVKNLYDAGAAAYDAKNYEEAVTNLVQVVAMDEKYDNGYAVYYLARSYEALQQNDEAIAMFQKFLDNYPGTSRAKYCTSAIARLGGQVQTQSTTQTQATTQDPATDTAAQDQAAQQ